ncbi:hypothetical protein O181_038164 [Austropuccinia psidii MF-1]|uniref:Uncharacterized protein n=1 Tax=Austropuccinia psidii MF-1 TaxID=1389203 RepID=A0A9Q3D7X9_9BASI|nr:hypothetical protein [Austropuccinia psidii MF-1]
MKEWCIPEMEAAIQSNQMDLDKEEVRPKQGLPSLPQERNIWRIPELPPVPQVPIQKLVQSSKRRGVGNMHKPLAMEMNSYLHIKSFMGEEKTIKLLGGWSSFSCKDKVKKIQYWLKNQILPSIDQKKEMEMIPDLEEGPVASTTSKPAP